MAGSEKLLSWLLEFRDDCLFRVRVDLFHECVDDPLLLHTLSCLVSLRVKVIQPLMFKAGVDDNLFATLQLFLVALGCIIMLDSSHVAELK